MIGLKDLIQQAHGLQTKIKELQDELAEKTVTGSSGGDMVRVEVSGAQELISLKIEKSLLDSEDTELLEDLIVAAVNDGLRKARDLATEEMSKLTGGIRLPGFM